MMIIGDVTVYTAEEIMEKPAILKFKYVKKYKKNKESYLSFISTFDIETTTLSTEKYNDETQHFETECEFACMYVWSMCVNGIEIVGRTWEEWTTILDIVAELNRVDINNRMVIYVHNLAFEVGYICKMFEWESILATSKRHPISALTTSGIEFRCSYKYSNMSLYKFLSSIPNVAHKKMNGDLDYRKVRHSKTPLTTEEWGYIVNDTYGLWEAMTESIKLDGETIASVSLTSTGKVRKEVKRNTAKNSAYNKLKKELALSPELYCMCKEAFRGGDTHANYVNANKILKDIDSFDMVSAYPAVQLQEKFPVTPFTKDNVENLTSDKAWIAHIHMTNVALKEDRFDPYFSISKCVVSDVVEDNGRVLKCSEVTTTITDIDFRIILDTYDYDTLELTDIYSSYYGYLPKVLTETIMGLFRLKTQLKIQIKNETNDIKKADLEYKYGKSKAMLNGIYGMSATDPIKPDFRLSDGEWEEIPSDDDVTSATAKAVQPYQWGVWTTAHCRKRLHYAIVAVGSGEVYHDTDSCKGMFTDIAIKKIDSFNKHIIKISEKRNVFLEIGGKKYYLGIYENEKDKKDPHAYETFKTLGAKKYCYTLYDGSFHITISGVRKNDGVRELQNIDNFCDGFYIQHSGGMTVTYYTGDTIKKEVTDCFGNSLWVESDAYVGLTERSYTIGLSQSQRLIYYEP